MNIYRHRHFNMQIKLHSHGHLNMQIKLHRQFYNIQTDFVLFLIYYCLV